MLFLGDMDHMVAEILESRFFDISSLFLTFVGYLFFLLFYSIVLIWKLRFQPNLTHIIWLMSQMSHQYLLTLELMNTWLQRIVGCSGYSVQGKVLKLFNANPIKWFHLVLRQYRIKMSCLGMLSFLPKSYLHFLTSVSLQNALLCHHSAGVAFEVLADSWCFLSSTENYMN